MNSHVRNPFTNIEAIVQLMRSII